LFVSLHQTIADAWATEFGASEAEQGSEFWKNMESQWEQAMKGLVGEWGGGG